MSDMAIPRPAYVPGPQNVCGLVVTLSGQKNAFDEDTGQIQAVNEHGAMVPVKAYELAASIGYRDPSFMHSLSAKVTFLEVLRQRGLNAVTIILTGSFPEEQVAAAKKQKRKETDMEEEKMSAASSAVPLAFSAEESKRKMGVLSKVVEQVVDGVFIFPQLGEIPRNLSVAMMRMAAPQASASFATTDEFTIAANLYDKIVEILSYQQSGSSPQLDRTSYFQIIPNGIPISLDVYKSKPPRSPLNPQGDLTTTEEFANLASMVFDTNGRKVDKWNIEKAYDVIIHAATSTQPMDARAVEILEKVNQYLKVKKKDEFTGEEYWDDSIPYARYKKAVTAYQSAIAVYIATKNGYDLTKPEDQRKWQVDAITLQAKIDAAKDEVDSAGTTVLRALTYIKSQGVNAVQYVIGKAKDTFDQTAIKSQIVDGTKFRPSYGFPSDWYARDDGFSAISFSTEKTSSNYSKEASSYGGSSSYSYGLFSVGGGIASSSSEERIHTDARKMTFSFKLGTIAIQRPWMDTTLFGLDAWSFLGQPPGKISSGKFPSDDYDLNSRTLPFYPTAFVVAKDIEVSGDWSSSDKTTLDKSLSGSVSVGFGPFSLGGVSYSKSSHESRFHSTKDGGTYKVPGAQIIGVINNIVPFAAPR